MMKKLTIEEIRQFTERPNVKKAVAENFLMSMSIGNGIPIIIENLVANAKSYKWNNETVEAILDGILTAGGLEINDLLAKR
jgi:hypothetical protein